MYKYSGIINVAKTVDVETHVWKLGKVSACSVEEKRQGKPRLPWPLRVGSLDASGRGFTVNSSWQNPVSPARSLLQIPFDGTGIPKIQPEVKGKTWCAVPEETTRARNHKGKGSGSGRWGMMKRSKNDSSSWFNSYCAFSNWRCLFKKKNHLHTMFVIPF